MSWLDLVKTDLIITTGDGKSYKPKWRNPAKSTEYNITEFDFIETEGTLVKRFKPRGSKYELEIYFDGEDHIDQYKAFEQSAKDSRAWVIEHPLYGQITVQPTGLAFDQTSSNVSKITGTVIETITEENPKTTVSPVDRISSYKDLTGEAFEQSFAPLKIEATEMRVLTANTSKLYKGGSKLVKLKEQSEEYFNLYNDALTKISDTKADATERIRAVQEVINYPSKINDTVSNRIKTFTTQLDDLVSNVNSLLGVSEKKIFENNSGTILSAMAFTSSIPQDGDYGNRNDVIRVIDSIHAAYELYLETLDDIESDNGGSTDSYIPDASSLIALNALINYTISNLFDVALNSKQERSILCEEDTNIIILAHRFYGLNPDDSTINQLIAQNNIGINEMLAIRKDRKIIYYV
jgi:hypothetical protein